MTHKNSFIQPDRTHRLSKTKGEDVSRLCVEMGKLIPLGEGYEDYYPSAKNSGGSVGVDDQQ